MIEWIVTIIPLLGLSAGALAVFRKMAFYFKVAQQAVDLFEELQEDNKDIMARVNCDPDRQELAKVLSGGIKKIKALTGI